VPPVSYESERRASAAVRGLVRKGLVAAKDISDGGLAVAAVEMSSGGVGCELAFPDGVSPARALFGEWQGAFLLAVAAGDEPEVVKACAGLPLIRLGVAGGENVTVMVEGKMLLDEPVGELQRLRERVLGWLSEA
jgi:phosphoribosylformylglycinamidine (FGAM) synthase-like enzyme